jgi:hypothetical protein
MPPSVTATCASAAAPASSTLASGTPVPGGSVLFCVSVVLPLVA